MSEQQKLLQSILSEAGIKLTDNQTLAVIDAVSLSCKLTVPYHEVMEFKEKYAHKRKKKDISIEKYHQRIIEGINSMLPISVGMPHHFGDSVREVWHEGMIVYFEPKGFMSGRPLLGKIIGHTYINVLIIECDDRKWFVSTQRCKPA